MAGLALSALRGIVPGIATYAVLRGSYYLFVERTEKVEAAFSAFKVGVVHLLVQWNARHIQEKDQINYENALQETGALAPEGMKRRECCRLSHSSGDPQTRDLSKPTCQELKEKMEQVRIQCCLSWRSVGLPIAVGTIGSAALSIFVIPAQVKSSSLFSRVLYRGVSGVGCLLAGGRVLRHFNNHMKKVSEEK